MPCECPAHLRVAFECRDALRDVARQLKAQNGLLERLARRPLLAPPPPGPPPALRAAADIIGSLFTNPDVKQGIQEVLHGLNAGKASRRRGPSPPR